MHTFHLPYGRKCSQRPEECSRYHFEAGVSFFFKAISQKWVINENYFFQHGYDNYMQHAWPLDELNPLACCGRGGWHLIPHTSVQHLTL